ncbi:MAG: circadian clock KaiB family protein [Bacteroidota bacterium]
MENSLDKTDGYVLKLFITGASPNSSKAITNIKAICDEYLKSGYKLDIIDIYKQPLMAQNEQIVALPLLIKLSPLPVKRLIGNMSDKDRVLKGLELDNAF